MDLFATAAKGTEPALRDELRELRFRGVRADRGGVHFTGELREGYRACIELRTAMRVLVKVSEFDAPSGEALYDGVFSIDWRPHLTPRHTLAVRANCRSSALTHTQFVAQKTKDAIVDQLRAILGARPSVDLEDPDVAIFVHIVRDRATIYLDLAGEPLHRRGYRASPGEAPLKETLAASILRLSTWDRQRPFLDPMCGSGTIAIEAALWAQAIAPGLFRKRFGFERWASFDGAAAREAALLREEARAHCRREGPLILATDIDGAAVDATRENARKAGVTIRVERAAIRDMEPFEPPGFVITNPPYGERLPRAEDLYRELGTALRRMRGHHISLLAGTPEIARAMPFRSTKAYIVFNGDIECRLLNYELS